LHHKLGTLEKSLEVLRGDVFSLSEFELDPKHK
jgi:hypothetical protein